MKTEIYLKPVKANIKLFKLLEKKKLIRLITPTKKTISTKTKTGAVSTFYTSNTKFGTHTLISVGKRTTDIKLSSHEDNEVFILINPLNLKFKKLFLILALDKKPVFLKKFYSGNLTEKDLLAIELKFNSPLLSFFVMLKNTIHCEITDTTKGQHPVFFVAEPSKLKDNKLSSKFYDIKLKN